MRSAKVKMNDSAALSPSERERVRREGREDRLKYGARERLVEGEAIHH